MELHNIHCEITLSLDHFNDIVKVQDQFGEFLPFPLKMWQLGVEYPYRKYFQLVGKPYTYVVDIFLKQYKHRYICNN